MVAECKGGLEPAYCFMDVMEERWYIVLISQSNLKGGHSAGMGLVRGEGLWRLLVFGVNVGEKQGLVTCVSKSV